MTDLPLLDPRGPRELVDQTEALIEAFTPWRRAPEGELDGVGALVRAFAGLARRSVDALNDAPLLHIEALLELLGMRPRPPRPARVPLVFRLAEGAPVDGVVPARTQVGSREDEAVVFETETALTVVRAALDRVLVREPAADRWGERDPLLGPGLAAPLPAFQGDQAIERALYLACAPALGLGELTRLELALDFAPALADPARLAALPLQLLRWDGAAWSALPGAPLAAAVDGHHRLRWTIDAPPRLLPCVVAGREETWLKVQVDSAASIAWWRAAGGLAPQTVITTADALRAIPPLQQALVRVQTQIVGAAPSRGLLDGRPLDLSRDFFPFDLEPRLGAALRLGFAVATPPGASVTLAVKVNPHPPAPPAASDTLELVWELRTADGWRELGRSGKAGSSSAVGVGFTDTTAALCQDGALGFTLPAAPVADGDGCWLRVWIAAGDYGKPARFDTNVVPAVPVPATFAPPQLRSLRLGGTFIGPESRPTAALLAADFELSDRAHNLVDASGQAFTPFAPAADPGPALYLGLAAPPGPASVSLYLGVAALRPADAELPPDPDAPRVQWEYRGAAGWTALGVYDETAGLTLAGLLRFTAPPDLIVAREFGQARCWLRARWTGGRYRGAPRLTSLRLNAVWARQAVAVVGEVLGSGAGAGARSFVTNLRPVLEGERVEVRELVDAPDAEVAALLAALPPGDELVSPGDAGSSVWVRWRSVVDLRGSGPEDRHYVLRADSGELLFGDGHRGRALPRGRNNLRIHYEHGGGKPGNCPPDTIVRPRASLVHIAGVGHHEPATGGADGEALPDLAVRGPAALRHGERAVAGLDLEDLAREASSELARVKAVTPRFDPLEIAVELDALDRSGAPPVPGAPVLLPDGRIRLADIPPETAAASTNRGGVVRLLVVARGEQDRPEPSAGLLAQVERHLRARCSPLLRLEVTGPRWVEVAVRCAIVASSHEQAERVCAGVEAALRRFLHPLSGGLDGRGWPFGRAPRRSDLGRVITAMPGVDHLRGLVVECTPPLPALDDTLGEDELADLERILIFSGRHRVTLHGVVGEGDL